MNRPFAHCTNCGAALAQDDWPSRCEACGQVHFLNPLPVSVLLQPTDQGVVGVRRDIEPHCGELALPGGFIEVGESWQEAAAREFYEETHIEVDAADISLFDVSSAPDGTVLIFGIAAPIAAERMSTFQPTPEVSELVFLPEHTELAFPLHTEVLKKWCLESSDEVNR